MRRAALASDEGFETSKAQPQFFPRVCQSTSLVARQPNTAIIDFDMLCVHSKT
jgi:hypothetical protein